MHHNVPLDKKLGVDPSKLLKIELLQSGDEGKNVEFFQKEVESVCAMPSKHRTERETKAFELFNAIQNSKTQVNSSITEPSAWEDIPRTLFSHHFLAILLTNRTLYIFCEVNI